MVFIDTEPNGMVSRDLIWCVFDKMDFQRSGIDIIKDMYEGAVTSVRNK